MVLKLYGSPLSGATRVVAFVLHEKKVPFELVPIDFANKEHKTPEYLEKQPFGQVPYIVSDVPVTLFQRPATQCTIRVVRFFLP